MLNIIWINGRAELLISGSLNYVINGGYDIKILGNKEFFIPRTNKIHKYDCITLAPKGGDYNEILNTANNTGLDDFDICTVFDIGE